jgi:hypothetical protein
MTKRSTFALIAVVAAALGGALPASGAVVGAKGLKYVTKAFPEPDLGVGTYKAGCPDGTHVYGGGHYNGGGFFDAEALHSFPFDSDDPGRAHDDGWGAQLGIRESHHVEIYAICAKPKPSYVRSKFTMGAGPTGLLTGFSCGSADDDLHVISGGTRGDPEVAEETSFPINPNSWSTSVSNTQSFYESSTLNTVGVCAELDVAYPSAAGTAPALTQGNQLVGCPDGTYVVGGGQNREGDHAHTWVAASHPTGLGTAESGWRAWIDNGDPAPPDSINFTAYAVCVPPLNGP